MEKGRKAGVITCKSNNQRLERNKIGKKKYSGLVEEERSIGTIQNPSFQKHRILLMEGGVASAGDLGDAWRTYYDDERRMK